MDDLESQAETDGGGKGGNGLDRAGDQRPGGFIPHKPRGPYGPRKPAVEGAPPRRPHRTKAKDDPTKTPEPSPKAGSKIDLDALRGLVGPDISAQVGDGGEVPMLDLKPEEVQAVLSVVFYQGANALLRKFNREKVTDEEADRWAKATDIVYGQWLHKVEAGVGLHALLTVAILSGKKKLPAPPEDPK